MEQNKKLNHLMLVGIAYNQNNAGVYGLILQEVNGTRRLPIAIGSQEAHSIEAKLTEVIPERPLTHDLMANIFQAIGLELSHVVLKQLENGIYAADLYLTQNEKGLIIDSRSSDAIALAIRLDAPIYATEELLEAASFRSHPDSRQTSRSRSTETNYAETTTRQDATSAISGDSQSDPNAKYRGKDLATLKALMHKAVEEEEYEEAGRIKGIIDEMADSGQLDL